MTEEQKSEIIRMRTAGAGFSEISYTTGIPRNTVKSFCQRNKITVSDDIEIKPFKRKRLRTEPTKTADGTHCKECGAPLYPVKGKKAPIFCSAKCRTKWWNAHPEAVNRKAVYSFVCKHCGKPFTAYGNKERKFCSHECYISARFREGAHNG